MGLRQAVEAARRSRPRLHAERRGEGRSAETRAPVRRNRGERSQALPERAARLRVLQPRTRRLRDAQGARRVARLHRQHFSGAATGRDRARRGRGGSRPGFALRTGQHRGVGPAGIRDLRALTSAPRPRRHPDPGRPRWPDHETRRQAGPPAPPGPCRTTLGPQNVFGRSLSQGRPANQRLATAGHRYLLLHRPGLRRAQISAASAGAREIIEMTAAVLRNPNTGMTQVLSTSAPRHAPARSVAYSAPKPRAPSGSPAKYSRLATANCHPPIAPQATASPGNSTWLAAASIAGDLVPASESRNAHARNGAAAAATWIPARAPRAPEPRSPRHAPSAMPAMNIAVSSAS